MSPVQNSGEAAPDSAMRLGPQPPPVLARPAKPLLVSLWILAAFALVLAGARCLPLLPVPLPACGLRTLTGLPCPLCGSTRCFVAWSHLEPGAAFGFNPMVATMCVLLWAWLVLAAVDWISGRARAERLWLALQRRPWPGIVLALMAVNWVYLIFFLPP